MEQFRQIGEVLGSLKALMVFQNDILVNKCQCLLLVDALNLAFETISQELRENLKFDEKQTKWKGLEQPLRELLRIFREVELYIRQCMETKNWWVKAMTLNHNSDCIEFHLHNLLCCIPVVMEAIEMAGEASVTDQEKLQRKKIILSKKYDKDWLDLKLYQVQFGKQFLVSKEFCNRMASACKEDKWVMLDTISSKRKSMSKHEKRLADMLAGPKGNLSPTSVLVGSKDYQVRRRLGCGSQYKEVQWMGENFAVRHFFGGIEQLAVEISFLSSLTHPNILQYMSAFSDDERKECFLVMELMNRDLSNYIGEMTGPRRKVPFSLTVAVDIMLQIARGMEYLHSNKICHGDLNPSNILVKPRNQSSDGYLHVKIFGFGLSSLKSFKTTTNQTTTTNPCIWCAPEILWEQEQVGDANKGKHTEKADVYSFAMICFEVLTGKVPFEDSHLQGEKMSRNIRIGERPLFPFPLPKYLTNLTKRCWHTDPSQRPNFSSICRMLRYIKRYLLLNPDPSQPDPSTPSVDYFEIENNLSRRFPTWTATETVPVMQIPFQMFAYKVMERDKNNTNYKDRSSESGSDGTSVCGDENSYNMIMLDDPLPPISRSPPPVFPIVKKAPNKKVANGKTNKQAGQQPKVTPLSIPRGHSLRANSEYQIPVKKLLRRRSSGHISDSELP